jgi:L-ribulose-5-phosphate 3-epimerase
MNKFGIMQGRLLPKFNNLYQAHPVDYWQDEFYIAKDLGLEVIQFILDYNLSLKNPLFYKGGIDEIKSHIDESGVIVDSICADYFMVGPIHSNDPTESNKSLKVLEKLIVNSSEIGVNDIIIPCVDQSSLNNNESKDLLIKNLSKILFFLDKYDTNLSLETDLPPREFIELISQFDSQKIKIHYDTGNSAALGFSVEEELDIYGEHISNVHIKDRRLNEGPCMLGDGDVKFTTFFNKLSNIDYKGSIIFQAFRDNEGVEVFKKQYDWLKPLICNYNEIKRKQNDKN